MSLWEGGLIQMLQGKGFLFSLSFFFSFFFLNPFLLGSAHLVVLDEAC